MVEHLIYFKYRVVVGFEIPGLGFRVESLSVQSSMNISSQGGVLNHQNLKLFSHVEFKMGRVRGGDLKSHTRPT